MNRSAFGPHIRGVYPRGLIEARTRPGGAHGTAGHIRGVYPRGLIEANTNVPDFSRPRKVTSAGSTPAASLKLEQPGDAACDPSHIRGVYPRGLIEARRLPGPSRSGSRHIRGVYPRGLIEAWIRVSVWRSNLWIHPRGLPPRPH